MYASRQSLRAYLDISSTSDDGLLDALLLRAQDIIDRYTGRAFEATVDITRYYDAVADVDGPVLWLDGDLAAITSIVNGDGTAVISSQYVTVPRNVTPYYAIRLLASSGLAWTYSGDPEGAISVTGRWAYSISPPLDIEHATLRLASYLYRQRAREPLQDRPIVSEGVMLLPGQLPQDIQLLLNPYVRRT